MEQFKSIGTKQCFVDAVDKVTGKAKYLDDISFPGLLIGKILRSPIRMQGYFRSIHLKLKN